MILCFASQTVQNITAQHKGRKSSQEFVRSFIFFNISTKGEKITRNQFDIPDHSTKWHVQRQCLHLGQTRCPYRLDHHQFSLPNHTRMWHIQRRCLNHQDRTQCLYRLDHHQFKLLNHSTKWHIKRQFLNHLGQTQCLYRLDHLHLCPPPSPQHPSPQHPIHQHPRHLPPS